MASSIIYQPFSMVYTSSKKLVLLHCETLRIFQGFPDFENRMKKYIFPAALYLGAVLSYAALWFPATATAQTADALMPYDEAADAVVEVAAAIDAARKANKLLLINFGANWCPDCRAFAAAAEAPEMQALIDKSFVSVKVDVGNWDKHPDLVASWGNPIEGGIPSIVVATPERELLFSTKAGQLSKARRMGPTEFAAFFEHLASLAR